MIINLTSVHVDDQRQAQKFYTEVLGFITAMDIPMGEDAYLTVVSPDDPEGTQLLLEPSSHPAVKPYRDALVADGIPAAAFTVDSVEKEYGRLTAAGVVFVQGPTDVGGAIVAVFDDQCGNLIQIMEETDK